MYRHVRFIVTHAADESRRLVALGLPAETIVCIPPGIDLRPLTPQPRTADAAFASVPGGTDRFRVLFATTPHVPEGVDQRGVSLLIEAARALPDVDFVVPWRPFPGAAPLADACRRRAPTNVHISMERVADMRRLFAACDATVAPFTAPHGLKVCPTSLIESLALGRPVLVSTACGMAGLVEDEHCGVVHPPTVDGLVQGIGRLRADYQDFAARSRIAAERHFDLDVCVNRYAALYAACLRGDTAPATREVA
jgi:glycosyltransferase involved in cell wall biosynthesis